MRHSILAAATCMLLAFSTQAHAFHNGDLAIGATTASGGSGGALAIGFDFSTVIGVSYDTTVGPTSIYSATEPGFDALDVDVPAESLYQLDPNTEVGIEITAIDAGKIAMKFDINSVVTVLDSVGDTVVLGTKDQLPPLDIHHHPAWQLLLMLPAGEFGEGSVSFKMIYVSGPTYTESAIYTLHVSNGSLAPVEYDTVAYDTASLKCLKTSSKEVGKLQASSRKVLAKCLDAVQVVKARTAAGLDATSASAAAESVCADAAGVGLDAKTMLGQLAAIRQKAFDKIQKACGAAGSNEQSDEAISAHLGLAACRTQEVVTAEYNGAKEDLEAYTVRVSQGGDALTNHLPCVFRSQEVD